METGTCKDNRTGGIPGILNKPEFDIVECGNAPRLNDDGTQLVTYKGEKVWGCKWISPFERCVLTGEGRLAKCPRMQRAAESELGVTYQPEGVTA